MGQGKLVVEPSDGQETVPDRGRDQVADAYERYASCVAAYALRRTSRADAADVTAETFLVAWRRRDALPDEPDTLPWLYGVARRVLANQRRSSRRQGRLRDRLEAEFFCHDVISQPPLESAEEFERVARALARLSDDDAELLRLITWEGLTPTEIATMLDIVPGTARQRVSRARQRLRDQLDRDQLDREQASEATGTTPSTASPPGEPANPGRRHSPPIPCDPNSSYSLPSHRTGRHHGR